MTDIKSQRRLKMKKLLEIFSAGIEDTKILSNQLRVKSFLKEYGHVSKKMLENRSLRLSKGVDG